VFGSSWFERTKALWRRGTRAGKALSVVSAVVGIALVAGLAYLLVLLIPALLFGAFLAAICSALAVNRGDPRMR
jgi:uncharacterized membrane protein